MRPFFKVEVDCKAGQKMTRIEIGMKKGDEASSEGTHSPKKAGMIDFSHPMQDFI